MSDTDEKPNDNRTICFCHAVKLQELVAAIRAGATTIEAIQDETGASTGCGGCEFDVREILEDELAKLEDTPSGSAKVG